MKVETAPVPTDLVEHPAAQAWARLDGVRVRPTSIERLQKKRKGLVYRLRGAGPGGTNVVAKRSSADRIVAERTIYEEILPRLRVSVVRYYGFVEEADGGWVLLEDAGDEAYLPRCEEHRGLAGRWLGLLHSAATTSGMVAAGCLRDRSPDFYREQLRCGRAALRLHRSNPALTGEHVSLLNAVAVQCDVVDAHWLEVEAWCTAVPPTFVHGDFAPKNMRVRSARLLPFDWGSAGWGSVAPDLAQNGNSPSEHWDYWADPDLDIYAATMREHSTRVSAEEVRMLAVAGKIFRSLVCISLEAPSFACDWVENAARNMRIYRTAMAEAFSAAGWKVPRQ